MRFIAWLQRKENKEQWWRYHLLSSLRMTQASPGRHYNPADRKQTGLFVRQTFFLYAALCDSFPRKCFVGSRLVPQLKIKIQDPQDPTPLQDFRIQDPPGSHTKPEF